ncbi:MAG TPA: endonuclease/exonuclease/phosphatase family protein [Actinomycetes bacterium]
MRRPADLASHVAALPRGVAGFDLSWLALPALTVTFGLQLLRLMVPTILSVERDRLGAPVPALALFAFGVMLLGFLGAPLERVLGSRRLLAVTAAGVGLVRLALQLIPDAMVRWLVAPLGVVLFVWFVPAYLGATRGTKAGHRFGVALLVGLALDTALQGLFMSWDYAWRIDAVTVALALALAGGQLAALRGLLADRAVAARPSGAAPWALPLLVGVGPALFLEALVLQNIGWQAVIGHRTEARAFLLVMVANLAGIAAGAAVTATRRPPWPVIAAQLLGLGIAVAQLRERPLVALLLGQVNVAALLVMIVCCAASPGDRPTVRSVSARTHASWALGMLLFMLLVFVYYVGFQRVLPFDNQALLPAAAVPLAMAGIGARLAMRPAVLERGRVLQATIALGLVLLVAPAGGWSPARSPMHAPGRGFPVRVLSYNLHFGYDVAGWSDLEAVAHAVEGSGAEVVAVQEVSRGWYVDGATDMLAWLRHRLHMPYAAFGAAADALWGSAILSRQPILASGVEPLPSEDPLRHESLPRRQGAGWAHVDQRSYVWARIDLGGGQTVRVIATHLHHIDRGEGDDGSLLRLAQARRLLAAWDHGAATVVMGDFNAHPDWPEITLMRRSGLQDAWVAAGGPPAAELTHPSDHPAERVDYIWLSPDLRAGDFSATTGTASDHRGIAVTISR